MNRNPAVFKDVKIGPGNQGAANAGMAVLDYLRLSAAQGDRAGAAGEMICEIIGVNRGFIEA